MRRGQCSQSSFVKEAGKDGKAERRGQRIQSNLSSVDGSDGEEVRLSQLRQCSSSREGGSVKKVMIGQYTICKMLSEEGNAGREVMGKPSNLASFGGCMLDHERAESMMRFASAHYLVIGIFTITFLCHYDHGRIIITQ